MRRFWLFVLATGLGGLGAVVGSILGNALGARGLYVGALLGGALGVVVAASLGARFGLFSSARVRHAILGGLGGFAVAAVIAVNTLSSPVGPLLSAALIGLGMLFGAAGRRGSGP
jgi:hypothetical protein